MPSALLNCMHISRGGTTRALLSILDVCCSPRRWTPAVSIPAATRKKPTMCHCGRCVSSRLLIGQYLCISKLVIFYMCCNVSLTNCDCKLFLRENVAERNEDTVMNATNGTHTLFWNTDQTSVSSHCSYSTAMVHIRFGFVVRCDQDGRLA